jgi:hypothetical protein
MSETEKFLILENQLKPYLKILGQAADVVKDQNVSNYPIFVVHQQEIEIGLALIEAGKKLNWSVNASTLEEFVTKDIISNNKVEDFIKNYKSIETHLCIFVLSELGAQFIFLPR